MGEGVPGGRGEEVAGIFQQEAGPHRYLLSRLGATE